MLFNKNIVLEIFRTHFEEEIAFEIVQSVMDLESYELEKIFGEDIDFVDLDSIEEMDIEKLEVDDMEDDVVVSGVLKIAAILDGYVHWDGENEFITSKEVSLSYRFKFTADNNEYKDLDVEYMDSNIWVE